MSQRRTGGVLGGLGPLATVQFMQSVLDASVVDVEQDYVDLIVTQRSSTPDRTAAIFGKGPSPAPQMAADARRLEQAGAEFIVIPCNTASHFLDAVVKAVNIPVLSIVNETVAAVVERLPQAKTIGLMATDGTIATGIYHEAAQEAHLEVLTPEPQWQSRVMSMIYDGVKRGKPVNRDEFFACVEHLRTRGADAVIAGCTEISVLCAQFGARTGYMVDSLDVLARRTVELGGGTLAPLV